jgi:enoyl-CoA hydratase/carnithine racemase
VRDERVVTVLFDAPPHNLIGRRMVTDLDALTRSLERDRSIRSVVLTGAREGLFVTHVAAISGPATGGGCELALACDLRHMAADDSLRIGLPEMTIALPPRAGGSQRLSRALGASRALEMMLEGRTLTPGAAQRDWLVEYTSVQRGLPDARHERHFAEANGELDYRLAVEFEPRPGWRGRVDRTMFAAAVERAMRRTVANLENRFALPPFGQRAVAARAIDARPGS